MRLILEIVRYLLQEIEFHVPLISSIGGPCNDKYLQCKISSVYCFIQISGIYFYKNWLYTRNVKLHGVDLIFVVVWYSKILNSILMSVTLSWIVRIIIILIYNQSVYIYIFIKMRKLHVDYVFDDTLFHKISMFYHRRRIIHWSIFHTKKYII